MNNIDAKQAGSFSFDKSFTINRIGYGTMQLTGKGVWGPYQNKQEAINLIKHAFKLGINFIDTADSYGSWYADTYLAQALSEYPAADQIFISDKVGLTRVGPNKSYLRTSNITSA